MKYLFLFCAFALLCPASAQVTFDPMAEPVAVQADSSLRLVVSEYVLLKSFKARIGNYGYVRSIDKKRVNGLWYLMFKGVQTEAPHHLFLVGVPLLPDEKGFYFAAGTGPVCEGDGCNSCEIRDDTDCFCNEIAAGTSQAAGQCIRLSARLNQPLLKVNTEISPQR